MPLQNKTYKTAAETSIETFDVMTMSVLLITFTTEAVAKDFHSPGTLRKWLYLILNLFKVKRVNLEPSSEMIRYPILWPS